MAEALLQVVLRNLNSLIQEKVMVVWGVDNQMKGLSSTLSRIHAVLEDAEMRQLTEKAVEDWLRKLQDAAYEVDDILDDCKTEAFRLKVKAESSRYLKKVSASLQTRYPSINLKFCHKIGERIKEIRRKLDAIAKEKNDFHFREATGESKVVFDGSRETGAFLPPSKEMYGRNEDREKIVKVLVEEFCDKEVVSVYPIIGIGGLGKTTLAQMVFNDERIQAHFDLKIWVYVSEEYDVRRVMKKIIRSASGNVCETLDLDSLQGSLREGLYGKRFLIVLDDVWNEDLMKWDKLKDVLDFRSKGACIIVTSRKKNVASVMGNIPAYHLPYLSDGDCWELFSEYAFGEAKEGPPNLVSIGKEIVKKCGGVPLAAKALGALMRFKNEEYEWIRVKESEIWNLPQNESSILPALRLSYYNLPLESRRCFSFCAVFPKGSEISKQEAIHLWMANGCIPSDGNMEPEEKGNEIFKGLCWRSLFQYIKEDEFGAETTFKMHDLVHDLSQSLMQNACRTVKNGSSIKKSEAKIRHVTLVGNLDYYCQDLDDVSFLRTLRLEPFGFRRRGIATPDPTFDFTKFVSIRAFYAQFGRGGRVPSSIGSLKHLRYLKLYHETIKQIPDAICCLWNLETLILECSSLEILPKNTKHLRSLRHIYVSSLLIEMPPEIGSLTCLKTLNLFVVGKTSNCSKLRELKHLDLGGELFIKHLERVKDPLDAKEANMVTKKNIYKLILEWERYDQSLQQENVEEVFEALEPHRNVKVLVVRGYGGTRFPRWRDYFTLANVLEIELACCRFCSELPPLGQLPLLRKLWINRMDDVEYIANESFSGAGGEGFPSLEELLIWFLPNLKGLSREHGRDMFPRLRKMSIGHCPELSLPYLPSLEKLYIDNNCTNILLNSIANISSLTELKIDDNKEAVSFPEVVLAKLILLESLAISNFTKLELFPKDLACLVSLRRLHISYCPELVSFPEQGLRGLKCLQRLDIRDCKKLCSFSGGLRHLTALESLQIRVCPQLIMHGESFNEMSSLRSLIMYGEEQCMYSGMFSPKLAPLPEALKLPDALKLPEALKHAHELLHLSIESFWELESLPEWLGHLTSLQSLNIWNCPKISSLPKSIQSLTQLKSLWIGGCNPELSRRCEKEKGEDWHQIAHIPNAAIW